MQNLGAGFAIGLSSPRKDDGRPCRRDHKHFVDRMVSDVHGEDRAGPEPLGLHLHLFDSEHFAFSETFLVGVRAAAHNIGNPSEKISDEIRSENRLTPGVDPVWWTPDDLGVKEVFTMPQTPRYPMEFRCQMVLVRAGLATSSSLGADDWPIHVDEGRRKDGLTSDEREEFSPR